MKIADGCFGMPIGRHTKPLNVTAYQVGEGRAGEVGLSGEIRAGHCHTCAYRVDLFRGLISGAVAKRPDITGATAGK
jgi:hypothetical protein